MSQDVVTVHYRSKRGRVGVYVVQGIERADIASGTAVLRLSYTDGSRTFKAACYRVGLDGGAGNVSNARVQDSSEVDGLSESAMPEREETAEVVRRWRADCVGALGELEGGGGREEEREEGSEAQDPSAAGDAFDALPEVKGAAGPQVVDGRAVRSVESVGFGRCGVVGCEERARGAVMLRGGSVALVCREDMRRVRRGGLSG